MQIKTAKGARKIWRVFNAHRKLPNAEMPVSLRSFVQEITWRYFCLSPVSNVRLAQSPQSMAFGWPSHLSQWRSAGPVTSVNGVRLAQSMVDFSGYQLWEAMPAAVPFNWSKALHGVLGICVRKPQLTRFSVNSITSHWSVDR